MTTFKKTKEAGYLQLFEEIIETAQGEIESKLIRAIIVLLMKDCKPDMITEDLVFYICDIYVILPNYERGIQFLREHNGIEEIEVLAIYTRLFKK